jgi:hypothetical protein
MKPSAFELAAIEAKDGVKAIDAEIEQLNARKQTLEAKRALLESLAQQLSAILPMGDEGNAADRGSQSATAPEAQQPEQPAFAQGAAKGRSPADRKDDWSSYIAASARSDAPESDQPSVSDLLSERKPQALRAEGWPFNSSANGRGIKRVLP